MSPTVSDSLRQSPTVSDSLRQSPRSYRLFGGQPILELSVLDFNKDCDSNQVEFSHLPAIDRNKAMAILKPGEERMNSKSFKTYEYLLIHIQKFILFILIELCSLLLT